MSPCTSEVLFCRQLQSIIPSPGHQISAMGTSLCPNQQGCRLSDFCRMLHIAAVHDARLKFLSLQEGSGAKSGLETLCDPWGHDIVAAAPKMASHVRAEEH